MNRLARCDAPFNSNKGEMKICIIEIVEFRKEVDKKTKLCD